MQLEQYGHGGDLRTAEERYGISADRWLDFSSNMNPWGPPAIVEDILRERWKEITRYPDPAVRGLRAKLSEVYRVPMDSILVGNGAAELIDLIIRVLNPAETVLARPCFTEYEEAVHKAGGAVRDLSLDAAKGFVLDDEALQLMKRENGHNRWVFLGHPNNPTGRLIPMDVLYQLKDCGVPMILDEAFMDFLPDEDNHSFIREAAESENIVVIRSMTKFYAVPGIRLGFIVANPRLIKRLKAIHQQWSVNYLAQLIGEAVLDDHGYAARTRTWLLGERPWLIERLRSLDLKVVPSDVNYLLVSVPAKMRWHASSLQQAMARRGIMIRDASLFQGLDPSYFRVAIKLRHENERLLAELEGVLRS